MKNSFLVIQRFIHLFVYPIQTTVDCTVLRGLSGCVRVTLAVGGVLVRVSSACGTRPFLGWASSQTLPERGASDARDSAPRTARASSRKCAQLWICSSVFIFLKTPPGIGEESI